SDMWRCEARRGWEGVGRGRSILAVRGCVNRIAGPAVVDETRPQEGLRGQLEAEVEAEEALQEPARERDVAGSEADFAARAQRLPQAGFERPQEPRWNAGVIRAGAAATHRTAVAGHEADPRAIGRQVGSAQRAAHELGSIPQPRQR